MHSPSPTIANYQQAIKERDALISRIQLENLALKGALRESSRLLQTCVELMQRGNLEIPEDVATHLGMRPEVRRTLYVLRSKQ